MSFSNASPRLSIAKVRLLLVFCGIWMVISNHSVISLLVIDASNDIFETSSSNNSTLGFGHMYVITKPNPLRLKSMIQAANVTELQLTVPVQPAWKEDDERSFRLPQDSSITKGSLLAWLGHLHALRQFIDSGAETALFLEDDVDWDIRLRTTQTSLVSAAMRYLLGGASLGLDARQYPYGDPSRWDLLYLGHCGDYWHGMDVAFDDGHVTPEDLKSTPHAAFADPSMPSYDGLHPFTTSLLKNLGIGEHTRLVHRSVFPLCTFAYALSRVGALRLLELGGKEPTGPGHKAYDILVLHSCRDRGLRCWTVNPELFHHTLGPSVIDQQQGTSYLPPVDLAAKEQIEFRGETPNINCGFWNGWFSFNDNDIAHLSWLREEVGRKGRCLKPGRELRD